MHGDVRGQQVKLLKHCIDNFPEELYNKYHHSAIGLNKYIN